MADLDEAILALVVWLMRQLADAQAAIDVLQTMLMERGAIDGAEWDERFPARSRELYDQLGTAMQKGADQGRKERLLELLRRFEGPKH